MSTSSTRPRTRAAAKEASREALIAAAMDLFAQKGLDVSLDELCARAGYTRGAFYVHFKDRDGLIAAVMERVGRGAQDALLGPAGGVDAIVRRFAERLASGAHPVSRIGGVRPYQLLDATARSPAVREGYVALMGLAMERLSNTLRENQKSGDVRPDIDAAQVATLLQALVIGLEIMHDLDAPLDLDQAAATVLALLKPS